MKSLSISIHALLAESDLVQIIMSGYARISIHALLAESDQLPATKPPIMARFLSTLSLRRATRTHSFPHAPPEISIHALLAESD